LSEKEKREKITDWEKAFIVGDYTMEMESFFLEPEGTATLEKWNTKYGREHSPFGADMEEDRVTIKMLEWEEKMLKWEEIYKTGIINSEMREFFISTDKGKETLIKWRELYGSNARLG